MIHEEVNRMKKWRYRFRSAFILALTVVMVGKNANDMSLYAQAKSTYNMSEGNKSSGQTASTYEISKDERMTTDEKRIYDATKSLVQGVAAGETEEKSVTVVEIDHFTDLWDTNVSRTVNRALSYLLMDCPYDLYWYDKDAGAAYEYKFDDNGRVASMKLSMAVAAEYQDSSNKYKADTEKTSKAKEIARKAQTIVNSHWKESDYKKLKAYMNEICKLVSYNWDVYDGSGSVPYGNPWQPVWVFDGEPDTNVVCEGYAKAFQYLCDLSIFVNAKCYTVEGFMQGGIGNEGNHMWNIVTLEGRNYLVDVTNCDEEAVGYPDQLFLAGGEGSPQKGYTISLNQRSTISYQYASGQSELLGEVLELSPYSYQDPDKLRLTITEPTVTEVVFGDAVDNQVLTGGLAVNGDGEEVSGTFTWDSSVNSYGNVGTHTLNAVFTPDNPQYQPVNNVRVSVKVAPRPVTVQAERKSKAYGQPDPVLTYTYTNVIEGCPLSGELARTSGEEAGTYSILQGSLTDANNPNYTIAFTGNSLEIVPAAGIPLEFIVGNVRATAANAVTVKQDAAYGDLWPDIIRIGTITAKTGAGEDSVPGHFTLQESGSPAVGGGQSFHVLYNGTIGGQAYRNEVVCEGRVDVKRRVIQVSAGSYKITKAYDKTRAGGTASGQLALNNLLAADVNRVNVTAAPTGYTSADVGSQNRMAVNLALSGVAADNYELANSTVEVPCEITPKVITPTVKVSGSYAYTGRAITPTVTVADGTDVLAASDYALVLSNNKNTGTAKVSVRSKNGGNYTWNPAVETSFTIDKADYKGTKTGTTSMEYGGIAVFSMYSMLSEGYKLGDIHVEDKDQILAEAPSVSGTVLSCKLTSDRGKEGKSAVITLPVTESANYRPYNLTFTVTMAAQRADSNNQPAISSGNGTGQASAPAAPPSTDIQDAPSSTYGNMGNTQISDNATVSPLDIGNSKSGRTGSINMAPIIGGALGITLAAGIVGGIHIIRRRKKIK